MNLAVYWKRVVLGVLVVVSALLVVPLTQAQNAAAASGEERGFFFGPRFDGQWVGSLNGVAPFFVTLTSDGKVVSQTSLATAVGLPFTLTNGRGIWRRTGRRSLQILTLRFQKQPDGDTRAIERLEIRAETNGSNDELTGTFSIEEFPCELVPAPANFAFENVPVCPDVTTNIVGDRNPNVQNVPIVIKKMGFSVLNP